MMDDGFEESLKTICNLKDSLIILRAIRWRESMSESFKIHNTEVKIHDYTLEDLTNGWWDTIVVM